MWCSRFSDSRIQTTESCSEITGSVSDNKFPHIQRLILITRLQIVRLTKYHQKATPWPLYSPFMEFIAPQLVLVAKNQNQILEECCALLQVSPTQFFSRTAEYTIPVVVGKCDTQLLDHISKQLDISTANIVIDDAQRIIAHIFMLESVETAKSLQFIAHIVSRGKNIEPSMLVRGYLNGILGELVIHLGDEDSAVKTKVRTTF